MKKILACILVMALAGCVGVPIERKFPATPESFKEGCPDLQLVAPDNTKLSDMMVVVTENYKQYQICQIKVESWQEWYATQKKIFDSVK